MKRIRIILLGIVLSSAQSFAGPVADTFRDGIFGISWGALPAEIEQKHPGGKWSSHGDLIRYYTIKDPRPVLGIKRTKKNEIAFGLSSDGRLNSVSITFPRDDETYVALLLRAKEQFGSVDPVVNDPVQNSPAPILTASSVWPSDEGIEVRLIKSAGAYNSVSLSIQNTSIKPSTTDNGFN
jgi:hypothetical protein